MLWYELLCLDCSVLLLLSRFYGALLGSVCILYLLPLCWVLAILNSTLFLGNTQFYQGKRPALEMVCVGGIGERPSGARDPALDLSQHPHVSPVSCVRLCHVTRSHLRATMY